MSRTKHSNLAARMGRWSASHWKTATFGWLAFVLVAFGLAGVVGSKNIDLNAPGPGESGRVDRILDAGFKQPAGESVLIQSRSLRVSDPAFTAAIDDVVAAVSKLQAVQHVRSPLATANTGQIAKNSHAALVEFDVRGDAGKAADKIQPVLDRIAVAQRAHPQFFIGEFGEASAEAAVADTFGKDLAKAGVLSIPITLIILLVAFGALVAAGIPLLLALTAVFATLGVLALPSHLLPLANEVPAIVLLVGLAVGVDYSMFYLKRVREERAAGRGQQAAIEAAAATSGRSVLISGLTVMVAMAGMFLTGDAAFASFGLATMTVVATAMLGSLTVLPALLSRLGDNVDRLRVPFVGRLRRDDGEGRIWGSIVDRVLRRPLLSAVLAGGVLVALALPALQLHLATLGPETLPHSLPAVKAYNQMQQAFPGKAIAANVVVKAANVNAPTVRKSIARLEQQALASGRAHEPITVDVSKDATVANITVPIDGKGADARLERCRRKPARDGRAGDGGRSPGRRVGRHRLDSPVEGRQRQDQVEAPARVRVRPAVRVRAHAGRLPLDRDRGEGNRAQPALGGSRVRRAGARLPARLRQRAARVQLRTRDRPGDTAAAVRDPLRALDGLPRLHPEPDPRDVRSRRKHR